VGPLRVIRGDAEFEVLAGPRADYTYAGPAAYEGAYPNAPGANPEGFFGQLKQTLGAMALFYAPFAPALLPAVASTPILGSVVAQASRIGGALRPTIEAITTEPAGTTTGREETSSAASEQQQAISEALARISSQVQQLPWGTSFQTVGPSAGLVASALALPDSRVVRRRSSKAIRASQRLSPAQRKALLREARALLQR